MKRPCEKSLGRWQQRTLLLRVSRREDREGHQIRAYPYCFVLLEIDMRYEICMCTFEKTKVMANNNSENQNFSQKISNDSQAVKQHLIL